jgi:formylglycine-generating enzyme required for sulfatase activity
MTFAHIPAGRFMMGADPGFVGDGEYERPPRRVTLSRPFRLSRFEVTQGDLSVLTRSAPGRRRGAKLPADGVSWEDAQEFLARLNAREGTGKYRLPTEAEWERAARAGSETAYWFGDDPKALPQYGWCGESFAKGASHEVGLKPPNPWGLYDMHGNLSEWVSDWFGEQYYASGAAADPQGPRQGQTKVRRGGGWASDPAVCQSAWREHDAPTLRSLLVGFRVAYFDE